MKKTKLHEALDIIVPIYYRPNAKVLALIPHEKTIQISYLLLFIALVFINSIDALLLDGVYIRWAVIWIIFWVFGVYTHLIFNRHHRQMDKVLRFCRAYTGIHWKSEHILDLCNKVYFQSVAENIVAENE